MAPEDTVSKGAGRVGRRPPFSPNPARVVVERVTPEIDGGRFAIKRTVGESVLVEADIFADGHEVVAGVLLYRREGALGWHEVEMEALPNDRWRGCFVASEMGCYRYTVEGFIDPFETWRRDFEKRVEAGQDARADLMAGARLVAAASERASGADAMRLAELEALLRQPSDLESAIAAVLDDELSRLMRRYRERLWGVRYERELGVIVERERARFSSWYEMFPRSSSPEPNRHGTFRDCEARLPYVARMGFDVLYFPPIHPIGVTHRKGKNNQIACGPNDPGSPWAIGGAEGGHKAVHPQLGTLEDFRRLVAKAREAGLEIALDIAFQCSPDHPYVKQHPSWFKWRPDGTIQYAENPPKKYEDIFPLNFDTPDWEELWEELKSVVMFWVEQGVRIFRVDNPHTKPFAFWEWLIGEVRAACPEAIFLSEAFTRPKVMYRLAKLGFSQSYSYFAWRNTKSEIVQYFTELTQTEVSEFFRANLWPNTPDILTEYLQWGGRPAFMIRLVLAATLGASYGIYGPAFELCEDRPLEAGKEEYLDSEKYEIRYWDLEHPDSLAGLIARVNRIRRENPALQWDSRLRFHDVDNDQLVCFSKVTEDLSNVIIVVVNLDYRYRQSGWVELELGSLGLDAGEPYQVHDLLGEARYLWQGPRNYVELDPATLPAHIFRVRKRLRREDDFEYFL